MPAFMRRLKPGMGDRGDVLLAPGAPGEIVLLHLDGVTPWAIQKGEQGRQPTAVVSQSVAPSQCNEQLMDQYRRPQGVFWLATKACRSGSSARAS